MEWLCENGAQKDIQRLDEFGDTILKNVAQWSVSLGENKRRETLKWLILNGALEERPGEVSYMLVKRDLGAKRGRDDRRSLLSWAEEAANTHRSFQMFLMGTLCRSESYSSSELQNIFGSRLKSYDVASIILQNTTPEALRVCWQKLQRQQLAISCLNGKPGVLQQISEFVGVVRGRELRIKEQLAEKLKLFLEDIPEPLDSDSE